MLTGKISTVFCKAVEIFLHFDFLPDLSTGFLLTVVEKPVENVDNPPVVLPEIFHNVNFMLTYVLSCAFPEKASSIFPENVLK